MARVSKLVPESSERLARVSGLADGVSGLVTKVSGLVAEVSGLVTTISGLMVALMIGSTNATCCTYTWALSLQQIT